MSRTSAKSPKNKQAAIAEEFFMTMNHQDLQDAMALFSENASLSFPGSNSLGGFYLGKQKIRRFIQKLFIFVPDLHFTIKNILQSEKTIVVEWISSGITKKAIPYENRGVSIMEMEDEWIKEMRLYLDTEKLRNP